MTEQQLAEVLGIAQQTMAHYEEGTAADRGGAPPVLAKALKVWSGSCIE
ncbi:MAG: helix-turn-helix transcriptional regulator [Pseudomonadota bacterium]